MLHAKRHHHESKVDVETPLRCHLYPAKVEWTAFWNDRFVLDSGGKELPRKENMANHWLALSSVMEPPKQRQRHRCAIVSAARAGLGFSISAGGGAQDDRFVLKNGGVEAFRELEGSAVLAARCYKSR